MQSRPACMRGRGGAFLVNFGIAACAAYRMQLFLYLKTSGREELGSMNLCVGVHPPAAV